MSTTTEIDNSQDIIDSRDVIERLKELNRVKDAYTGALEDLADDPFGEDSQTAFDNARSEYDDIKEELTKLESLADEASGCDDWEYGAALIRESYFTEYAQEFAEDIGAIDRNANWPVNCIDWEEATDQLQQDYAQVDFDGETYLIRS